MNIWSTITVYQKNQAFCNNSKPGIDPKVPCFWKRDFVVLICCSTPETRRQLQYDFPPSGHQQEHHGEIYTAPVKRENSTEKTEINKRKRQLSKASLKNKNMLIAMNCYTCCI